MSEKVRHSFVAVRVPETFLSDLEPVTRFDAVALAEVVRAGVEIVFESRRYDPEFRIRVEAAYAEAQKLLEGVEGSEALLEVFSRPFPVT